MATSGGAGPTAEPERYRRIDGKHNNLTNPDWGSAGQQLLRLTSVAYGDGISTPAGEYRPSPRAITNALCKQEEPSSSSKKLSNFIWAFGQFLDHELDLTPESDEPLNMSAPANDPDLPNASIGFKRSDYDRTTGDSAGNPRQQINAITSFIDASNVYGSDKDRAVALRANDGTGKLRTDSKPVGVLLPKNYYGLDNANAVHLPEPSLFLGGDIRANEHSVLTSLHTLFVREHNRLCGEVASKPSKLAGNDDDWGDERNSKNIDEVDPIRGIDFRGDRHERDCAQLRAEQTSARPPTTVCAGRQGNSLPSISHGAKSRHPSPPGPRGKDRGRCSRGWRSPIPRSRR